MSLARLGALAEAAAAACDAELAALAALTRQIECQKAEIAALRAGPPVAGAPVPVAEALWVRGRRARLQSMSRDLADLLARREAQIARSRRAFGRSRAADELLRRARAKRKRDRLRAQGA